jgi:hypothetical protein
MLVALVGPVSLRRASTRVIAVSRVHARLAGRSGLLAIERLVLRLVLRVDPARCAIGAVLGLGLAVLRLVEPDGRVVLC